MTGVEVGSTLLLKSWRGGFGGGIRRCLRRRFGGDGGKTEGWGGGENTGWIYNMTH